MDNDYSLTSRPPCPSCGSVQILKNGSTHHKKQKFLSHIPHIIRLVANYGGNIEDWVKMSSTTTKNINGLIVQIHWFKNTQNNQNVEFKFKRTYLKTAPKNQ